MGLLEFSKLPVKYVSRCRLEKRLKEMTRGQENSSGQAYQVLSDEKAYAGC